MPPERGDALDEAAWPGQTHRSHVTLAQRLPLQLTRGRRAGSPHGGDGTGKTHTWKLPGTSPVLQQHVGERGDEAEEGAVEGKLSIKETQTIATNHKMWSLLGSQVKQTVKRE